MPVTCQSTVQTGQYVIAYNDPRHLNESIDPTVLQCPIHMLFCQDISMRGFAQGQLWTTNPTQLFEHRWCPASSFPDRLDFQGGEPFGLKSIRLLNSNCSSVSTSEWAFLRYKPGLLFYIYSLITRNLYPHNPASLRVISDDWMIKISQTRTSATENLRPSVSSLTFWLIHSKGKTSNG